jgi:hypothetical protein
MAISSLEHMPGYGDKAACLEILRTMKRGGLSIITVPGSMSRQTVMEEGVMVGIPPFAEGIIRPLIKYLFKMFQVDRVDTFRERRYSRQDGRTRLVPSGSSEVRMHGYALVQPFRVLVSKFYPYGFITAADAFLATRLRSVGESDTAGFLLISFRK